jgi:hypothetical protein
MSTLKTASTRSMVGRVGAIAVVLVLGLLSWWPGVQTVAAEQVDASLKRALVSFASARALNAVLSVAQGTEVALQPLGFGVTLSLGQVIEPVNRLVEQFAGVLLFASVAFGIEKMLLVIGSWWPLSAALTAVAALWALTSWRGNASGMLTRILVLLLVVRFAVPFMTTGSDYVFHRFLASDYAASQSALATAAAGAEDASPQAHFDKGMWNRIKEMAGAPGQQAAQAYGTIKKTAEQVIDRIIKLISIFLLQTVVLPLFLLWVLVRGLRAIVGAGLGSARTVGSIRT